MKKIDNRKLSQDAQETIRIRAIRMINEQGKTAVETARLLGVARSSVENWKKAFRNGGEKALKKTRRGRPKGRGKKLTPLQCAQTVRLIRDKCPDQLKMPFVLWTRKAVKELIEERTGVEIALRTVGDYLKTWGFTPQKPTRRAYEQQPAKIKKWLSEEYPAIAERAKCEGAEIHWGDETSLNSDCQAGRGFAPKGITPILRKPAAKFKVNMVSTITNQGLVRFMTYDGAMNADVLIKFLSRLVKGGRRKIFLILDNLRVHHAYIVRDWLAERSDQIEIFFLPPYSPELNPDEYLNCDVKGNANSRKTPRNKQELKKNLMSHMRFLQKSPSRVMSYFQNKNILYAAS